MGERIGAHAPVSPTVSTTLRYGMGALIEISVYESRVGVQECNCSDYLRSVRGFDDPFDVVRKPGRPSSVAASVADFEGWREVRKIDVSRSSNPARYIGSSGAYRFEDASLIGVP